MPRQATWFFSKFLIASLTLAAFSSTALADFDVVFGSSWSGISLQEVLDDEYGPGSINAATDYEGYLPGDADPPYWEDALLSGIVIREIAGYANNNILGWYAEDFTMPIIDGINDGVVFAGIEGPGDAVTLNFPGGITTFGFYLNPNGPLDSFNAPEPEKFFTNRSYNDIGPDGSGAIHAPSDGDPQCLIYNITHLRQGVPTFVLAWEDLDSGGEIVPVYTTDKADNDFNDLVVEITAESPVRTEVLSFGSIKALYDN